MFFLASLAFGASPAQIHKIVETRYKRQLPSAAVCQSPAPLPKGLREVVSIGTRQGARGCVFVGAVIDNTWYDKEQVLQAALDQEAFSGLNEAQKANALERFVQLVPFAFHSLTDLSSASDARGLSVSLSTYNRTKEPFVAQQMQYTLRFTGQGQPDRVDEVPGKSYQTYFFARNGKVSGTDTSVIEGHLNKIGRDLKACFLGAWTTDPTLHGSESLSWEIKDGKASSLTLTKSTMAKLGACYGQKIGHADFGDLNAKVSWTFGASRKVKE